MRKLRNVWKKGEHEHFMRYHSVYWEYQLIKNDKIVISTALTWQLHRSNNIKKHSLTFLIHVLIATRNTFTS